MQNQAIKTVSVSAAAFYRGIIEVVTNTLKTVLQDEPINIQSFLKKAVETNLGTSASASWCSEETAETTPLLIDASVFKNASDALEDQILDLSQTHDAQMESQAPS